MSTHYFIGINSSQATESANHFRKIYQLEKNYKILPHPDDLHMTLLFLGEIEQDRLTSLHHSLKAISAECSLFSLSINGLSFFGSP